MKGVEERTARYPTGAWQKLVFVVLSDRSLSIENLFECEVTVPHTEYSMRRTTLYSPGKRKRRPPNEEKMLRGRRQILISAGNRMKTFKQT